MKIVKTSVMMAMLLLASCVKPEKTTQILKQSGYTNITITGWRPFMASDSDSFSTGFEATAINGQRVSGAVTSGWFKGHTIRLD